MREFELVVGDKNTEVHKGDFVHYEVMGIPSGETIGNIGDGGILFLERSVIPLDVKVHITCPHNPNPTIPA